MSCSFWQLLVLEWIQVNSIFVSGPLTYKSQDTGGSLNATNSLNGRVVQHPLRFDGKHIPWMQNTGYPYILPIASPWWVILFTASNKLHFRASSFRHDACLSLHHQSLRGSTLWVNPFFLCRRKKGFVDPFIVIEWIQSRDADLLFYLGCQNLWTHPQRKHLSTQLAAPGTIFFYVVSLLRLVVLGLWFLTISCVVVCKIPYIPFTKLHSGVCCQPAGTSNACLHSSNLVNVCFLDCQQPIYSFL